MLNCYVHNEVEAVGTCVGCGKFICEKCNTELKGKNYCKKCLDELFEENQRKVEKLEDKTSAQQPMVFMNAGGGGGAGSHRGEHLPRHGPCRDRQGHPAPAGRVLSESGSGKAGRRDRFRH